MNKTYSDNKSRQLSEGMGIREMGKKGEGIKQRTK